MKLVTAIIKPFKLDEVRSALSELGVRPQSSDQIDSAPVTKALGWRHSSSRRNRAAYRSKRS